MTSKLNVLMTWPTMALTFIREFPLLAISFAVKPVSALHLKKENLYSDLGARWASMEKFMSIPVTTAKKLNSAFITKKDLVPAILPT